MSDVDRIMDTALLLRAQAGDSSALEGLILRHDGPLRYYVRRLVNDAAAADDVVQEVWLAAVRQIKAIRSGAVFRVWLNRVARNLAVTHLRSAIVRRALPLDGAGELPTDEDISFSAEDAFVIHQAMDELRVEHREVLTLRFLDEMTYEDMAEVIGCSIGTVRSRLHYAKKQLRQMLQENRPGLTAPAAQPFSKE
jgi:RNA polymerase sigma-70 factor (ECF subfamily)